MALVPANIDVNFTANYVGNHRVAYRIGNSGAYTFVIVNCAGNGTSCSVAIPISVDNETCPTVQFNGYVQPTCVDISSTDQSVAFSVSFIPSPTCKTYVLTCDSAGVDEPTVTNEGTDYDPLSPPAVLFTGGGGSGVIGSAIVGPGAITSTTGTITLAGSGYDSGTFTNVDITGGTGSGAKATVVVSGGIVQSITITTAGTAYLSSDTLGLDYTDMGMGAPPVQGATFTITSNYGKVIRIVISDPGSGYTTPPIIAIGASGGVQATADANLDSCPEITSNGCNDTPVVIPAKIVYVGDTISICSTIGTPSVDASYSIVQNGNCLCSGNLATISVTGTVGQQVRYLYNRLNGGVIEGLLTVGGSPSAVIDCVVLNSVVFQSLGEATGQVTYGGAC